MTNDAIQALLKNIELGKVSAEEAFEKIKTLPYDDLGFAKIDYHRELRTGFPEVIFCQSKTVSQIVSIIKNMLEHGAVNIMGTRVAPEIFEQISSELSDSRLKYFETARILSLQTEAVKQKPLPVAVVSGGTADMPVAEEAAVTLELFGNSVIRVYDVGVSGLHRLLDKVCDIRRANAVIAVAGMEGALASVVAGLVNRPVIAVPTSVGYGANFGGLSALLCMLNSCANGVSTVNIDNGFGAAYNAALINNI